MTVLSYRGIGWRAQRIASGVTNLGAAKLGEKTTVIGVQKTDQRMMILFLDADLCRTHSSMPSHQSSVYSGGISLAL